MENMMFNYLNSCSKGRTAWFLLTLSALALDGIALYFQHVMKLEPCVMCIYERIAVLGIAVAGIIGMIAPKTPLRWIALVVWIYSGVEGIKLAWEHTMFQLYPSPFNTCDFFVNFPDWLPLNQWVPAVFEASGDCSVRQWEFLTLDMPQWLIGIFAAYLLVGALVIISQFFKRR